MAWHGKNVHSACSNSTQWRKKGRKKGRIKRENKNKNKYTLFWLLLVLFCYHITSLCVYVRTRVCVCIQYGLGFRLQYIKYEYTTCSNLCTLMSIFRADIVCWCCCSCCCCMLWAECRVCEGERAVYGALMFGVFSFSAQQPIIKQHEYRSMSPFLTAVHCSCCFCCSLRLCLLTCLLACHSTRIVCHTRH